MQLDPLRSLNTDSVTSLAQQKQEAESTSNIRLPTGTQLKVSTRASDPSSSRRAMEACSRAIVSNPKIGQTLEKESVATHVSKLLKTSPQTIQRAAQGMDRVAHKVLEGDDAALNQTLASEVQGVAATHVKTTGYMEQLFKRVPVLKKIPITKAAKQNFRNNLNTVLTGPNATKMNAIFLNNVNQIIGESRTLESSNDQKVDLDDKAQTAQFRRDAVGRISKNAGKLFSKKDASGILKMATFSFGNLLHWLGRFAAAIGIFDGSNKPSKTLPKTDVESFIAELDAHAPGLVKEMGVSALLKTYLEENRSNPAIQKMLAGATNKEERQIFQLFLLDNLLSEAVDLCNGKESGGALSTNSSDLYEQVVAEEFAKATKTLFATLGELPGIPQSPQEMAEKTRGLASALLQGITPKGKLLLAKELQVTPEVTDASIKEMLALSQGKSEGVGQTQKLFQQLGTRKIEQRFGLTQSKAAVVMGAVLKLAPTVFRQTQASVLNYKGGSGVESAVVGWVFNVSTAVLIETQEASKVFLLRGMDGMAQKCKKLPRKNRDILMQNMEVVLKESNPQRVGTTVLGNLNQVLRANLAQQRGEKALLTTRDGIEVPVGDPVAVQQFREGALQRVTDNTAKLVSEKGKSGELSPSLLVRMAAKFKGKSIVGKKVDKAVSHYQTSRAGAKGEGEVAAEMAGFMIAMAPQMLKQAGVSEVMKTALMGYLQDPRAEQVLNTFMAKGGLDEFTSANIELISLFLLDDLMAEMVDVCEEPPMTSTEKAERDQRVQVGLSGELQTSMFLAVSTLK
ncbi:MAG: hypothetical protein H0X51_00010 [Parachlamydiaceae bacterium]|nr:hypothetical protein [Parachlamydiaceae bacterium]